VNGVSVGVPEDREARFRVLFEAGKSRLGSYALRRADSPEDAADVLAETFLIAWQRLEDVPEGEAGILWLYATARHLFANQRRRLQRQRQLVERLASELGKAVAQTDPIDQSSLEAARVLASLSGEDREILMLAGWEGLDSREIGAVLGCSAVAARIRLHRARGRMTAAASESFVAGAKHRHAVGDIPHEAASE
jgi:RNA polymerase sigma factor (sigma-70 family)